MINLLHLDINWIGLSTSFIPLGTWLDQILMLLWKLCRGAAWLACDPKAPGSNPASFSENQPLYSLYGVSPLGKWYKWTKNNLSCAARTGFKKHCLGQKAYWSKIQDICNRQVFWTACCNYFNYVSRNLPWSQIVTAVTFLQHMSQAKPKLSESLAKVVNEWLQTY